MFVARSVESEQVDENCRTFSRDELSESDSGVMRRLWGSKEASSCLLQDLQSEIETHRDVYASLNGTGRKLLSSLASQDDAVMLQRRLDEMNQRWHHLKAKSMAIRNRLESNTEHWNALLLSLRELIEWVIRKDTELTGLGPVCGDVAALQKQQAGVLQLCLYDRRQLIRNTDIYVFSSRLSVPPHRNLSFNYVIAPFPVNEELNAKRKLGSAPDRCSLSRYFCFTIYASPLQDDHRGFRRQLEDKRPVVENNLLSGRQYIANEPPLSDTSDSEAGRELDGDSRGYRSAEEQARELTRSIRREVNKLSEQWNALIERSDAWKRKLDDTANRFHLSERLCALEEATEPFIGEHQEKTFGNELPCSKDDPQMRSRPIDARVASNATEISSSRSSPEESFISIAKEDEEMRSRLLFAALNPRRSRIYYRATQRNGCIRDASIIVFDSSLLRCSGAGGSIDGEV
ncbi:Dystrophin, isoform D [Atta colombica]|uniref:Dystrophin, isoform D n=1 Tax=Atta colombica TaxID=520822 RepID=A0A195BQZ8_9HYME|nr:Dystrophin, isoform D [Atta colombica]